MWQAGKRGWFGVGGKILSAIPGRHRLADLKAIQ
jgi:hypothetical protein